LFSFGAGQGLTLLLRIYINDGKLGLHSSLSLKMFV